MHSSLLLSLVLFPSYISLPDQLSYVYVAEALMVALFALHQYMVFICLDRIMREEKLEDGDLIVSFVTEVSKFMQAGYAMTYYGNSA